MLKKTIVYQNLDGETVAEEFYFQLTKTEVAEKAAAEGEGYGETLANLSKERDGAKIMYHFKDLLSASVGRREGQLFIKDEAARNQFFYSGAYDVFFMEMMESEDSGASMLQAIFPAEVQSAIDAELAKQGVTSVELPASAPVLSPVTDGVITDAAAQADKPQPSFQNKPQAVIASVNNAPSSGKDGDDPVWLKENRSPTKAELMKMGKDEMLLAAKMREAGLLA